MVHEAVRDVLWLVEAQYQQPRGLVVRGREQ